MTSLLPHCERRCIRWSHHMLGCHAVLGRALKDTLDGSAVSVNNSWQFWFRRVVHLFDLVLISFHLYLLSPSDPRSFCGGERSVSQVLQGPGLTWLSFRFRSTAIACHGGSAIQSRIASGKIDSHRFSLPIDSLDDSLIMFPHEMAILPGHHISGIRNMFRSSMISHRPASRKIKRALIQAQKEVSDTIIYHHSKHRITRSIGISPKTDTKTDTELTPPDLPSRWRVEPPVLKNLEKHLNLQKHSTCAMTSSILRLNRLNKARNVFLCFFARQALTKSTNPTFNFLFSLTLRLDLIQSGTEST